ncbi:DgyrCDS9503 [Dimorphilus gyrociliatus]|uniref:DgyrCDS9503 n=1 Tax=Dimorphilus gyrociliatus TaxID=2664684 RepID=A0A7I8W2H2_9ANNE|nr:DgyrCDS9503 [Dimorphilus gyrociliatus]
MVDLARERAELALINAVKTPVIYERFLRKLPYQYVKDIAISILKESKISNILTEDDLKFKIDTFEEKVQLLQKIIEAVEGKGIVDEKDIISGVNHQRTLDFLLLLTGFAVRKREGVSTQNFKSFVDEIEAMGYQRASQVKKQVPKTVFLGPVMKNEIFDAYNIFPQNRMPLQSIFNQSSMNPLWQNREPNEINEISILDIKDIDFLNDYFFCLANEVVPSIKEYETITWKLRKVSLQNCPNVTDWSVFWIKKANNSIRDCSFNECNSLSYWTFETFEQASQSSVIIGKSKKGGKSKVTVNKEPPGECISLTRDFSQEVKEKLRPVNPYFNPYASNDLDLEKELKTERISIRKEPQFRCRFLDDKKAVIIHFQSLYKDNKGSNDRLFGRINFESLIANKKIQYCKNVFNYWKINNWKFYDCYEDYIQFISLKRSLLVIPFNLVCDEEHLSLYLIDIIIGLLQMNLSPEAPPVIIFVGFGTKIDEIIATYSLVSIMQSKIDEFKNTIKEKSSIQELSTLEFSDQNNIHNLMALTQLLYELKSNIEIDNSLITFINLDIEKKDQDLANYMNVAFKRVVDLNPQFKYTEDTLDDFIASINKKVKKREGFLSITEIMEANSRSNLFHVNKADEEQHKVVEICSFPYFKVLDLCHILGHIIFLKSFLDEQWYVASPQWFANYLQNLYSISEICGDHVKIDQFFLRKSMKVCQKADWYSSKNAPGKIFSYVEFLFRTAVGLKLPNCGLLLPLQLTSAPKEMFKLLECYWPKNVKKSIMIKFSNTR